MSTPDRWDRLAADLTAAGVVATLDRRPYREIECGRLVTGVSSHITARHPQGGTVEIADKYGRGGKWYGWTVTRIGADDILIGRPSRPATKRGEITATVTAHLA